MNAYPDKRGDGIFCMTVVGDKYQLSNRSRAH